MATEMLHSSREEELFAAALALPTAERTHYLARVCYGDARLLECLEGLLEASEDAPSFIQEPPPCERTEGIGDQIDRYRLMAELGEGGCGIAYLAEQVEPVKRQVALKVIKPGMDTRAVISRFEAERQILAVLEHPNIARVFDAGVSRGRSYFVMELVRGVRLTDYCNQARLTLPERLKLFLQVCDAIQHAHHRGVIHRDIKPSNVLVTLDNGNAIAKVIDFGLGKVLAGSLSERTSYTAVEQFLGTPAYVSPEQAEPGQFEVDTRSDIYSLGVLLYELLAGVTPFEGPDLVQSRANLLRRILMDEPSAPSKRLLDVEAMSLEERASLFGTSAAKLPRQVRGDLDWIVMKCLEKDRSRRYQTANDLGLDLARYLKHEAVLARPASIYYSIRKAARRHQLLFAAGVAGAVLLLFSVAFAITLSFQARRIVAEKDRAEQEKIHAEQISNIVLKVFAAADPFENDAAEVTAAKLLDQAAKEIKDELTERPEVRAQMLEAIGRAYRRRGEAQKAIRFLDDAVRVRTQMLAGGDLETLSAMIELSIALRWGGDLSSARNILRKANDLAHTSHLTRTGMYAKLLLNRARNEILANRLPQARQDLQQSLALSREILGPDSRDAADVLLTLSRLYQWTDDLVEAEHTAREAVHIFEMTVPEMYPDRVFAEARLAEVLHLRGSIDLADQLFQESLRKQSQLFGRTSWLVADVLDSLAQIRRSQGRLEEAEAFAREAIEVHEAALGKSHPTAGYLRTSFAALLIQRKKYPEAEQELRRSLELLSQTTRSEQYVASSEYLLGEVFLATGRLKEAETILRTSIERWKRSGAPAWRAARSASALGEALYRLGREQEAELHLTQSYRELTASSAAKPAAKSRAQERAERYSKQFARVSTRELEVQIGL